MKSSPHENAALRGVRVLDLADQPGQYCGKLLADMGADVIRIEPPGGSPVRQIGPFYEDRPDPNGSLTFWHYNTSKRGITLNLETVQGREVFRRLVGTADVVLETGKPGYMASLGLGYLDLKEIRPDLIMCSVTPFGQNGPWVNYTGSDLVHLALGGTMASCGYDNIPGAPPIAPTGGNAYHTASHFATVGILVALLHQLRTGVGQYLDVSVHDTAAYSTEAAFHMWVYLGRVVLRQTGRHAWNPASLPVHFRTRDGKCLNAIFRSTDTRGWNQMVAWMSETGEEEDLADAKYQSPETVKECMPHVLEVMTRFAGNHDMDYLYHGAGKRGLLWTHVRAVEDTMADPHLVEDRAFFTSVQHPELGKEFMYAGAPCKLSRSYWEIRRRAPLLGEHNREILVDELGVSPDLLPALGEQAVG